MASEYLSKPIRVKVGQVSTPTANVTQSLVRLEDEQMKVCVCVLCRSIC